MPIRRHGKVRRLLKEGKAKVTRREPFTIRLLVETESNVSDLTLGVDTGSSKVGCAVVTPKEEVLYLSEVKIRNDISVKMKRRAIYRRARRTRKTRYRKSKFLKGQNYRFANSKSACLNRDSYTCQCCKTKKGTLHIHHIVYRSNGWRRYFR